MVPVQTAGVTDAALTASRSVSFLRLAEKASRVFLASYFLL